MIDNLTFHNNVRAGAQVSYLFYISRFKASVTMAPKSKKTGENINARLALVMKSGKGRTLFRYTTALL